MTAKQRLGIAMLFLGLSLPCGVFASSHDDTATPPQLVQTYDSLADTLLAAKQTEWNLVHTILATTYSHAEGVMKQVTKQLEAGGDASGAVEKLAALVAQIGNEGDAKVAAIRKRLIEGGHHHHASGEQKGIYDPGFVIVTREAKKVFLDASKKIGQMSRSPELSRLKAEWSKVENQFKALHEGVR